MITLLYSVRKLNFYLNVDELEDDFIVAIDSTGIKVTNRGEWLREKHGKKRKGWLKIHVVIDVKEKRLIGLRVTDERVGDRKSSIVENMKEAYEIIEEMLYFAAGTVVGHLLTRPDVRGLVEIYRGGDWKLEK